MAWSTRELADLSGTTVNTIRHYHRLGLLEEPQRRLNGYKQYGVAHLVRLLRIRRLVDLGVPLSRIDEVGDDRDYDPEVLRQVDADLAAELDRLSRARSDIAVILRAGGAPHTPTGFESAAARLSTADSSMLHIYTRLYDGEAMKDVLRMVESDIGPTSRELDELPADADEATRRSLAERLAPIIAKHVADYPWLSDQAQRTSESEQVVRETIVDAVRTLYNPAQVDVLGRAAVLARSEAPG